MSLKELCLLIKLKKKVLLVLKILQDKKDMLTTMPFLALFTLIQKSPGLEKLKKN